MIYILGLGYIHVYGVGIDGLAHVHNLIYIHVCLCIHRISLCLTGFVVYFAIGS